MNRRDDEVQTLNIKNKGKNKERYENDRTAEMEKD